VGLFFSKIFQQSVHLNKINANESIDVFIDSVLVFDNLSGNSPQLADFELSTTTPAIEITTADAIDNSNPLASFHPDLMMGEGNDIYLPGNFGFMINEVEPDSFKLLLKKDMRFEALYSNKIDLFVTHGAENLGSIDIRLIDDDTSPNVIETLYDNIEPDSVTEYVSLIPGNNFLQITDADNSQQYGTFNFSLSSYSGEALFGSVVLDNQQTSAILLLYDSDGNIIEEGGTTSIGESETDVVPTVYELYNNYPNPFNPSTTINYSIPKQSYITLKVYDILGKEIETLVNEEKSAGYYQVEFNATNLPSGVYF
jgi:Secretion system C-terminal sorting domain